MKPASFHYHRAYSADQAVTLLAELGEDAKLIAGGQSLVAMMNFRLARPEHLIDLGEVTGLRYVRRDEGQLSIGALTTHHSVESEHRDALTDGFGVILDAIQWIGHLPIRTRGTVGGSLAHADAVAEWCLLAVLLDAEIIALSPRGTRSIRAAGFFHGYYSTALEPDEMIVEVRFGHPAHHAAMAQYAQRHGDFATAAAVVNLDIDDGCVRGGRVVLGGVSPVPMVVDDATYILDTGRPLTRSAAIECAGHIADLPTLDDSLPAGEEYMRGLVRRLVERALRQASHIEEPVR